MNNGKYWIIMEIPTGGENGIKDNYEFAVLTNEIYKAWSGMKASEYKKHSNKNKDDHL